MTDRTQVHDVSRVVESVAVLLPVELALRIDVVSMLCEPLTA